VAVEEHRRRAVGRADVGEQHREAAHLELAGPDVAGLEPALDEPRAELDALRVGAVVADQLLGQ
jgi:hypothetical protein